MGHALVRTSFGLVLRATLSLGESGNFPAALKQWRMVSKEQALATGILIRAQISDSARAHYYALQKKLWVEECFRLDRRPQFLWLLWWWSKFLENNKLTSQELEYINSDTDNKDQPEKPNSFRCWGSGKHGHSSLVNL